MESKATMAIMNMVTGTPVAKTWPSIFGSAAIAKLTKKYTIAPDITIIIAGIIDM